MNDNDIVALYWKRSETAIRETTVKYGGYCFRIANNILGDSGDAEECVNDTYLAAWNCIPPNKPSELSTFLGKIVRRTALKRLREKHAEKRGGGQAVLALDELLECIPSKKTIDDDLDEKVLAGLINAFVASLRTNERRMFVCRYWYLDSVGDIAEKFGYSQSKVKTALHRTRRKLLDYLNKEGVFYEIR